jgi:hypothetical protein
MWNSRRLAQIPAADATARVIRLLEHQPRSAARGGAYAAAASVRIAPARAHIYVVTSAVGNFLIGRHESKWTVVSLPGD